VRKGPARVVENAANQFVASPPEVEIARDMVRRALPVAPVLVVVSAVVWGWHGALSSAYGIALVLVNFLLAAGLLAWAARVSPVMLMVAALGGFFIRMGLVVGAVLAVQHASWVALPPLLTTILITHVGLLLWETRYVSATLAFPGLAPARKGI
jgi:hypothetical protein